jgi:hypothetical protein
MPERPAVEGASIPGASSSAPPRPAQTEPLVAATGGARAVGLVRPRPTPVPEAMAAAASTDLVSIPVAVPAPRTVVVRRDLASVAPPAVSDAVVVAANSPAMPAAVQSDVAAPAPVPVVSLPVAVPMVEVPRTPARPVAVAETHAVAGDPGILPKPVLSAPFVQLGSLVSESDAMTEWQRLKKRMAGLLVGREPLIESALVRGRTYWRLRTFGFGSASEASDMCSSLKSAGMRCLWGRG